MAVTVAVDGIGLTGSAAARGVGTYCRMVLARLGSDPALDVVALAPADVPLPAGVRRRAIHRWAPPRWANAEHRLRLPWDLRRASPAVVWEPTPDAPRRCPAPLVQTLLDVIPLHFPDPELAVERARWGRYAPVYRDAAAVIAISRHAADEGIEFLGLDPKRVHVCHLGAAPEFTPGPSGFSPTDPPYLLLVSEYSRRKGYEEAFAAIGALADAGHPHTLKVAGRIAPWVASKVDAVRAAAPRPDRIELLGFVDDLPALYRGATAFVGSSRFEGFGLPALEAMSCGTPVVAFDNSATSEVVASGGILVADGDVPALTEALRRVIDEPLLARELHERALERAAAFSWDRAAATHAEIIRSVAA